jgi:PAS domain S-box-containing protein
MRPSIGAQTAATMRPSSVAPADPTAMTGSPANPSHAPLGSPAPTTRLARCCRRIGLRLLSLRARLVVFAVLCALPVFSLLLVERASDEARIRAGARAGVVQGVNQLHRSLGGLLDSVEAVGRAVTAIDLDTPAALAKCNETLAMTRQATERHVFNVSVLDTGGRVLCSGKAPRVVNGLADRPYFRQALETRAIAVSGFLRSRLTGLDSVLMAVPRLDARGEVAAVVVTAIDARLLTHGLVADPPAGMVLAVYDTRGLLVSRFPDSPLARTGQGFPESGIARLIASGARSGVTGGPDGVTRLYEVRPVLMDGAPVLHVVVGQDTAPLEEAAAAVRRHHALVGLGVLVLVMVIAALAARPLVLARVRLLLQSARRVAAGERVRVPEYVQDELTPVETAFNDMLDALERNRVELERSEHRYRLLFDTGVDGVLHIGAGGEILAANGAACRLLQRGENALRGTTWPSLVDPTDERGRQFELDGSAARVLHGELRLLHPDGSPLECEVSASLFGPDCEAGLGSVVIRDLTLRLREQRQLAELNRRLEVRVQQRTADLEAAVDELTAFSYSVSHDLRAPMAAINGFACVLQERGHLTDPKDRHYLSRIVASSDHANNLIDGLLLLARITRDELVVRDVDLGLLAREAMDGCRDGDPGRDFAFDVRGDLRVRGDARLLRILIDNLVGNAWKFTGRVEHAQIKVERLPGGRDGEAIFHVRDNGAGFDPAHASRLFEPFQRLHSDREFPGTGIGLATAQRVVRRHGGRMWADSRPGQGTSLFFTLREPAAATLVPAAEEVHG